MVPSGQWPTVGPTGTTSRHFRAAGSLRRDPSNRLTHVTGPPPNLSTDLPAAICFDDSMSSPFLARVRADRPPGQPRVPLRAAGAAGLGSDQALADGVGHRV